MRNLASLNTYITVIFIITFSLFNSTTSNAEVDMSITKGNSEKLPIAITTFYTDKPEFRNISQNIPQLISSNLELTGLFATVNPRAFIQTSESISKNGPRFSEWRAINTQKLVTGSASYSRDGRIRVEFRLWDVFSERQLTGMAYTTTNDNWRRIGHIISDEIYKRITGESGYFDSRIVYISESGPPLARRKRLAIMDQDGSNHHYLTDGNNLVLTPRFSPTMQTITYLAYHNKKPRVYLYDINTGRQEVLGNFSGMTFAPRFSPDGTKVIMSLSQNGNSDIFTMDLRSKKIRQLTRHTAIDTAPSYSPDGKRVVFESDRGGSQQLYVMNADGTNPQRISFNEGRYGNPVWSPRGDLIAFTKMYKGSFYIGVMRPNGDGERLITTAYHVEGPSWSPNGRVLVYFKEETTGRKGEGRRVKLYSIDLTGYNEREIPTPQDASDPAWSPVNQ
jgi:TolB protein